MHFGWMVVMLVAPGCLPAGGVSVGQEERLEGFGLRIDEVLGSRTIFNDEIDDGLQERELGFVSHVTRDLVQIVDVGTLLGLPAVRIGGQSE